MEAHCVHVEYKPNLYIYIYIYLYSKMEINFILQDVINVDF
jgi:hypothetical protein